MTYKWYYPKNGYPGSYYMYTNHEYACMSLAPAVLDLHGRTPTEVPGSYDDDVRRAHSKLSSGKKHDEPE